MRFLKKTIKRLFSRLNIVLRKRSWKKKILKIYKNNNKLSKTNFENKFVLDSQNFFQQYQFKISPFWHHTYYKINAIKNVRYIPDDVFNIYIEPYLNRKELCTSYIDKNIYDKLFEGVRLSKTIIRKTNGQYLDSLYNNIDITQVIDILVSNPDEYIIKPSIDTMGGKKVKKIEVNKNGTAILDGSTIELKELLNNYCKDFLIQEIIKQHKFLKDIYPLSCNTIRVITLRFNGETHILSSVLRMENNGYYIDNFSAGGICCGINTDGVLNEFAVDKNFNKYFEHPYTKFKFKNITVSNFEDIKLFTKNLHNSLPPYFKLISWDVAIDSKNELNLIEFNMRSQQIDFHQIHNGPFGELTEPLLDEYLKNNRCQKQLQVSGN